MTLRTPLATAWAGMVLATLLGAGACVPQDGPAADAQAVARPPAAAMGTIVSARPAAMAASRGVAGSAASAGASVSFIGDSDMRANILAAIGGGTTVNSEASSGEAVEFIVREDTGQTVSVVQTNGPHLRPGERVVVSHGAVTRLARAAPGS